MQWYEAEVGELVARLAAKAVPQPVVVYGSSSIRLWTTLERDLGNAAALNAGFGGATLEACAHFFERIVPPLGPAALLVYAGDNDLGDGRSPGEVLESFRRLANAVTRCCGAIPFGFISIKPSPARASLRDRIEQANASVRTEIQSRPRGFYVDVYDAMLHAGRPRPELFLDDGLHLGPPGYALWTELLKPFHQQLFSSPQPPSSHASAVS